MGPLSALAIAGAGLAAGTINTIVGSGTLITFPTLLALGYPSLVANVSNTVGLVPGSVSGVQAYRKELSGPVQWRRCVRLGAFSVTGAVLGSALLFIFPGSAFRRVVPFLILTACLLVAAQPRMSRRLNRGQQGRTGPTTGVSGPGGAGDEGNATGALGIRGRHSAVLLTVVFLTGVYGGYFGAAQGVVLISMLSIFIEDNLQRLNAVKNVLALLANLVAGIIFAFSGRVSWGAAGVLAVGAIVGGQVGGRLGRRLPQPVLRAAIVVVGIGVSIALLV